MEKYNKIDCCFDCIKQFNKKKCIGYCISELDCKNNSCTPGGCSRFISKNAGTWNTLDIKNFDTYIGWTDCSETTFAIDIHTGRNQTISFVCKPEDCEKLIQLLNKGYERFKSENKIMK